MGRVKKLFRKTFIYVKQVWTLVSLIWKSHPLLASIWTILLITSSGFPALVIWLQKNTINNISLGIKSKEDFMATIFLLAAIYFSSIILAFIMQLQEYIFVIISETVNYVIKEKILRKAIKVPLEYYEQDWYYNRIMMANDSVNRNSIQVVSYIFIIFQQLFTLVAVYGILAAVHWSLPIALLISSLPGILLLFIAKNNRFNMIVNTTSIFREMGYTNSLLVNRENSREIRIFNIGEYLIQRWSKAFIEVKKLKLKQELSESKGMFIGTSVLQISAMAVAILLVVQIKNGHLTIGDYVALTGAASTVQGIFGTIGANLGNIIEVSLYNNALFDFLNMKEKTSDNRKIPSLEKWFDKIVVDNISFSYPNSNRKILDHVSMVINRGEKVAIVGENGAGKTTLANCILNLYNVYDGNILFGDINLKDIDEEYYRGKTSAVFQDFTQYLYNVRENVCFGNLSKLNSNDEIMDILDKVGLKEKIEKLPLGLDTLLGKEFRDGQELSGGEWQRIAIARALMRDAEIIILDEPTASLDPMAELEIFNCFQKLARNKTAIMISHRLGPIKFADRIFVLKEGKIIEEGKHEELIINNGEYARMYLAQSEWYQDDTSTVAVNI